jgi:Tfp pilus assembly protein PilE
MLFTLGGLGFWTLIDLLYLVFGTLKDGDGYPLERKPGVIGYLILAGFAVFVGLILMCIAIPQYSTYRLRSQDSAAQSALSAIRTSEELYYVDNDSYTDSYDKLRDQAGLVLDSLVSYGDITLYSDGNMRCFKFTTSYNSLDAKIHSFDSCEKNTR